MKIRFEITRDNTEIDGKQKGNKRKGKRDGITILFAAFVSREGWNRVMFALWSLEGFKEPGSKGMKCGGE